MTVTGDPGLRAGGSAARAGSAARSETRHGVTKRLCKQNLNIIDSIVIRRRRFMRRISTAAAVAAPTLHACDLTSRVTIRRPQSLMPTCAGYVDTMQVAYQL